MYNVVQIAGSLLILAAFLASLNGRLDTSSYSYLVTNLVGSAVLAVIATIGQEWGFLLLEGVWAIASGYSVARKASGAPLTVTH